MTTHPTLYDKDSRGEIRVWWIEQDSDKYRMCSGLENGQIVRSEWTAAKVKNKGRANETSPEVQATKEIDAAYEKKLKTSYNRDRELAGSPKYVEPMLAQKYVDRERDVLKDPAKYWIQCKLNGARCIATKDGLKTRKGEVYQTVPHISAALREFFELYPEAVLDGELYNYDLRQSLNELITLVRKTVHIDQSDLDKAAQIVQFHIYDGYGFGMDEATPYSERSKWIEENAPFGQVIRRVVSLRALSSDHIQEVFKGFVNEGEEGIILRRSDSPYEHKRSKFLIKLKPEDDAEFIFMGAQEGTGNWSGRAKIINLYDEKMGRFNASFKGTMEEAAYFLHNHQHLIGKSVRCTYFGLTGLGVANFCQFDYHNYMRE